MIGKRQCRYVYIVIYHTVINVSCPSKKLRQIQKMMEGETRRRRGSENKLVSTGMMGEYICTGVYNAASTIDENTSESESENESERRGKEEETGKI